MYHPDQSGYSLLVAAWFTIAVVMVRLPLCLGIYDSVTPRAEVLWVLLVCAAAGIAGVVLHCQNKS